MNKQTIKQMQSDVREHLADKWNELTIYERAEYISGVRDCRELHDDAFNSDYYIIGTWQATQWMGGCVFEVIELIKEYESDYFGEITTDFSDPERIVNMYAYIQGEQAVYELLEELKVA